MGDRIQGLTVVFSDDLGLEDAQELMAAIKLFRGVADVAPSKLDSSRDFMARERVRVELISKLFEVLKTS